MGQKVKVKNSNLLKSAVYLKMRDQDLHFTLSHGSGESSCTSAYGFWKKPDHFHYPNSLHIVILLTSIITADLLPQLIYVVSCLHAWKTWAIITENKLEK